MRKQFTDLGNPFKMLEGKVKRAPADKNDSEFENILDYYDLIALSKFLGFPQWLNNDLFDIVWASFFNND